MVELDISTINILKLVICRHTVHCISQSPCTHTDPLEQGGGQLSRQRPATHFSCPLHGDASEHAIKNIRLLENDLCDGRDTWKCQENLEKEVEW